jgi:hypothetical protein
MCRFVKNFLKVALGLTSATVLVLALQAQAAASEGIKSGPFLLAQSAESQKEKQAAEAARDKELEKQKQMEMQKSAEQKMEMEKKSRKVRGIQPPPAASGTKKIGGQIIRDKESPDRE